MEAFAARSPGRILAAHLGRGVKPTSGERDLRVGVAGSEDELFEFSLSSTRSRAPPRRVRGGMMIGLTETGRLLKATGSTL